MFKRCLSDVTHRLNTPSMLGGGTILALMASLALVSPAYAIWPIDNPPAAGQIPTELIAHAQQDGNGVDIAIGAYNLSAIDVMIGQAGAGGLAYSRSYVGGGWRADAIGTITHDGSDYSVSMGGGAETFTKSGSDYTPDGGTASTLTEDGSSFTYTTGNGAVFTFSKSLADEVLNAGEDAVLTLATAPSGATTTFHYVTETVSSETRSRLQSVTNSFGYQLHLTYADDAPANTTELNGVWLEIDAVTAINNAEDYCSPTANTCTGMIYSWPEATYTGETHAIATATDPEGRTTNYTYTSGRLTKVRYPGSSVDNLEITYNGNGQVTEVDRGYATWTYSYSDISGKRTTMITLPGGGTQVTVTDIADGTIDSVTDPLSRTTEYEYDAYGRVTKITAPEGNFVAYTYDSRGNVLTTTMRNKGDDASIITSATYPGTCTYPKTCNKPETTTDALGEVTNYTYDNNHGGVTSVKAPDPDNGGSLVRPESRMFYAQKQARYLTGVSTYTNGAQTYVLEKTAACATSSFSGAYNASASHSDNNCGGGSSDKTQTETEWPGTGSANNLQPLSTTAEAGDASACNDDDEVCVKNEFTYNRFGWTASVDGPLAGSTDTIVTFYNDAGQVLGSITPDPDGVGSLLNQAVRTVYDSSTGLPYRVETGTAVGQTESNFNAMTVLQKAETVYDDYLRPVRSVAFSGDTSTVLAVSQVSYDSAGRTECSASRMNPSEFASLPMSACSLSTAGSYGADRITKNVYNYASEVTKTISAYGTALQQDTVTITYTDNGLTETVTDANGNKTTYTYDGFDRLKKTCFPSKTTPGTSSATDCEENFYTAAVSGVENGLLDHVRPRKGSIASGASTWDVTFTYDDLGRVIRRHVPDSAGGTTADEYYDFTYDNFGRLTSGSHYDLAISYAYDQLGRLTSKQYDDAATTFDYDYDAAGRLTTLTYPDGFEAHYSYDVLSRPISAVDGNSNTIVTVTYDDHGRRASLDYGNSTDVAYHYDALGRLDELEWDLTGSVNDVSYGYAFNPGSQLITETVSNSLYNYSLPSTFIDDYAPNGLNQYSTVDGTSVTYDDNGNLTTDKYDNDYAYDAENRLRSVKNTSDATIASYRYSSEGHLYYRDDTLGIGVTRHLHDGGQELVEMTGDYDSPTTERAYVRLPGSVDEPILMIDYTLDTCTVSSYASCEVWAHQNRLGSVIATTDSSGNIIDQFTYSPYGESDDDGGFPFRFTGQKLDAVTGLYYYKARWYDPETGRFLQTDPIGYGDGMNMYAYVGGDPANGTDPSGLKWVDEFAPPVQPDCFCDGVPTQSFYSSWGDGTGGGPGDWTTPWTPQCGTDSACFVNQGGRAQLGESGITVIVTEFSAERASDTDASSGGENPSGNSPLSGLDKRVVQGWKDGKLAGVLIDYSIPFPKEQFWVVFPNGAIYIYQVKYPETNDRIVGGGQLSFPDTVIAVIHTHPTWAKPRPGPEDYRHKRPLYGIWPRGVWVIRPGGQCRETLAGNRAPC